MKSVVGLLTFVFISTFVWAQEIVHLSLATAMDAALNNNNEVLMAGFDEQSARARFRQNNASFLPQVQLSYSAMSTTNPLNAFGFKLQQQSITASDFDPARLNSPSATQNYLAKAEWQQPIINMDMFYMRKAAHYEIDVYAFKEKRTREYLVLEIQKAYAQIQLAHQAVDVLEEALHTISALNKTTHDRFEKGLLQKSDVLNVQVQTLATETQLAEAKSNVQTTSDILSLVMGKSTGVIYQVDPIEKQSETENTQLVVPANRSDFMAMQSAVDAQDVMIGSSKMSYLPKLNGFAEYLINDNTAFGFGSDAYLIGAQLSWKLFNGLATQNKVAEQRIERNKMATQLNYQKEHSQLELNKTLRDIENAKFSLEQSMLSVTQATEALRILQNRFDQGLVATNDLLQANTQLSHQKLSHAKALYQFNTLQAYLQFLTIASNN